MVPRPPLEEIRDQSKPVFEGAAESDTGVPLFGGKFFGRFFTRGRFYALKSPKVGLTETKCVLP